MRISDWSSDVCSSDLSRFTSQESLDDAAACARALGIRYTVMPIGTAADGFDAMLGEAFEGTKRDLAEENLQSRIRGTALLALSKKFGERKAVVSGRRVSVRVELGGRLNI